LKGQSAEDDAAAAVLRQWLDNSGLRINDIHSKLTPEHFKDGRVPSRSTLSDRLAGVALRQDFIEAVADICSSTDAAQQQLLEEVRAARQQARRAGASPSKSTVPEAQLVLVQQRSLEVSDRLLRALERQQQLERERNDANQMVLILLTMVDKLQRDITILNRERDRLRVSNPAEQNVKQVYERLAKSEQQRQTAETELARAKTERQKADQLAEEAAEQVRVLTEELERLRGEVPDATATAEAETTMLAVQAPLDVEADDIDLALSKAARHLDNRADRLDQLASELHLDNPPDISPTSNDATDNSQMSDPDAAHLTPEHVVDQVRTLMVGARAENDVENLLHVAGQTLSVSAMLQAAILLRDTSSDGATQLLHAAIGRTRPAEMPGLIGALRTRGQDAELYQLLNQVARHWSAWDLTEVVTALRQEAQDSDAYQVLSAVGRDCPPLEVLKVLARLAEHDADWVVDAACRDRPLDELPALEEALRNLRKADAAKVAAAHEQRKLAGSRKAAIAPRPRPASLLGSNYEDDDYYPLVRPYAMSGGDAQRPGYRLPAETVVRTAATPDQLRGLLPEHQRICEFCRDPHNVISIAHRLNMPLGVARILVADLAEAGLVQIHEPGATSPADTMWVKSPRTEETLPGLRSDGSFDTDAIEESAPFVEAGPRAQEEAGEDKSGHGDAALPPARQAFVDQVADLLIAPLLDAGWTNARISAAMDRNISYATLRRIAEGEIMPGPRTLEAVIELVGRQRQLSVEANTRLMTAYLRALREADPALYDQYLEEDEGMRRLSASDSEQAVHDPTDNQ
jgi:hypothetical protein